MRWLQGFASTEKGRLLRILFIRFSSLPADSGLAVLLHIETLGRNT
jgi:hypothetical protein